MKNPILLFSFFVATFFLSIGQALAQAQISISESGVEPDPSAMLDIQSTGKGVLFPRMTATQRDAINDPATGLSVFVTNDSSFYYFDGTNWALLGRQDLSLNGNTLSLTNGGSVNLSPYLDNTDAQMLSLTANTLSLANGGSVDLGPFAADNLGDHTATQNIGLNGHWISNDGSNNGLFFDGANKLGIGTSSPAGKLHVFSTTNPLVTFKSDAGSTLILDRGTSSNETALQFRTNGSDSWLVGMDNLPSGYSTDFSIKKTNNSNPEFVVTDDGKVGIGGIDPLTLFHINAVASDESGGITIQKSSDRSNIYHNGSGDLILKKWYADNQLVLDFTGNVGIGTDAPEELLHVNGSIKASDALIVGNTSDEQEGSIRWTGDDFEGFDGAGWKSLTETESIVDTIFGTAPSNGTPILEVDLAFAAASLIEYPANQYVWQSFTIENTGKLATLKIDHDTKFIQGGYLRIYDGEGVSGALLHEQTIDDSNTSGFFATYDLVPLLAVEEGNQYTFEVTDTINEYRLAYKNTDPYPGGLFFNFPDRDLNFKTYVIPVVQALGVDGITGAVSISNGNVVIDENGNMGINTDTPASKLHVKDNFASYSQFVMTVENTGNANGSGGLLVQAGENSSPGNTRFIQFNRPDGTQIGNIRQDASSSVFYATTSDERLKTSILQTAYGLDDLLKIDVRDYFFKDDLTHPQTGFIAQQLFKHYPNAVTVGGEDAKTDPWQVDYSKLTPLLVKSVQELKQTVDKQAQQLQAQQTEIEQLKNQNVTMQSRLEKIEAMLESNNNH